MVMVCYFKRKQTTFVQSKKLWVYLFRLIARTCKVYVLAVLRHLHYKYREYRKGFFRFLSYLPVYVIVLTCLNTA
jgi:hypothetical protein